MAGPYGERPQACYYVYTAAQVVGFVVRTLYIVLQDDTSSEESETLDMAEVLSDLPAEWSDEVKMQAIEGNYGKRFDMMHYWADEGDIPKLTLFAAFLERTYKTPADFEKLKPGLMTAGRVAQEKIYKFCLPLTVRPQTSRAGCTVPRRAPSAAARYPARYPAPRTTLVAARLGVRSCSSSSRYLSSATRRPARAARTGTGSGFWR
jgi:hypothetical protein